MRITIIPYTFVIFINYIYIYIFFNKHLHFCLIFSESCPEVCSADKLNLNLKKNETEKNKFMISKINLVIVIFFFFSFPF